MVARLVRRACALVAAVAAVPTVATPWTAQDVAAATVAGDSTQCYYVLWAEGACTSAGGVYRISTAWYTQHSGGPFAGKTGAGRGCGSVKAFWGSISSAHQSYNSGLINGGDITGPSGIAAHRVAEYDCLIPPTNPPTTLPPTIPPTEPPTTLPPTGPPTEPPTTLPPTSPPTEPPTTLPPTNPPMTLATACDAAACNGRGSTFDQDDSDGCVCFCNPGFGGTSCEIAIAAPACPLHNATSPGGLLRGYEHYTQLGEQGRLWYELEGGATQFKQSFWHLNRMRISQLSTTPTPLNMIC